MSKSRIVLILALAFFFLYSVPVSAVPVQPELTLGIPVAGNLSETGAEKYYQVRVVAGQHLFVVLDSDNNHNFSDLYIKFGSLPNTVDYEAKGASPYADQAVEIPNTRAGYYYVMVRSQLGGGNYWISVQPVHEPLPRIGYTPGSFTFFCARGQANPFPQNLEVLNSGGGTLNWTAIEGVGWLSLTPTSGSSTGEHDFITLSVDASSLSTATYTATITLSAPGAYNAPQQIPVTLVVAEQATHTVTPSLQAGWNMIAVPLALTNPSPEAVFPTGWPLFLWDAVQGSYRSRAQITLALGDGYWLKAPSAQPLPISGQANGQANTEILLSPGWNLIGTPYHQPVPWASVSVRKGAESKSLEDAMAGGWIKGPFFRWDGTSYQTVAVGGSFQHTSGYWIKDLLAGCSWVFGRTF